MTYFPVMERLGVSNYGLYPGAARDGQLEIEFKPGLVVILGANGLGKSTLIQLVFRILTGPYDISLPEGSVGTALLEAEALNRRRVLAFAARVADAAVNATATLTFSLGPRRFTVTRALKDLSLVGFALADTDSGEETPGADESALQAALKSASNAGSFGEFIYLLRTMVFFFEDRRQLVWDPSAQRQLLRQLLLTRDQAASWQSMEREILQADTRMRNLQAALRREEREDAKTRSRVLSAPGVRAALEQLKRDQDGMVGRHDALVVQVEELDGLRHRHRFDLLRAESDLHAAVHELERARLSAVEARFPSLETSLRYIFSRLMTDDLCKVCDTPGRSEIRQELVHAIDARRCLICKTPLPALPDVVDISEERIALLRATVESGQAAVVTAKAQLSESATAFESMSAELSRLAAAIAENKQQIDALIRQLPPEEQSAHRRSQEMTDLHGRVAVLRADIRSKREHFANTMATYRDSIRSFAVDIKREFESAASGFLLESSALTWAPTRQHVGQAGADGLDPVEYPSFSVEMTGANFGQMSVRRDGPDQVSESQREFIDLAFRMALIQVAAPDKAATILIDAPESSLDAVFVRRAAGVLARFANSNPANRLIATSNLAAGKLIPAMLNAAESDPSRRRERIVDLFELGVPTRAMQELNDEYQELREELFTQIGAPDAPAE